MQTKRGETACRRQTPYARTSPCNYSHFLERCLFFSDDPRFSACVVKGCSRRAFLILLPDCISQPVPYFPSWAYFTEECYKKGTDDAARDIIVLVSPFSKSCPQSPSKFPGNFTLPPALYPSRFGSCACSFVCTRAHPNCAYTRCARAYACPCGCSRCCACRRGCAHHAR